MFFFNFDFFFDFFYFFSNLFLECLEGMFGSQCKFPRCRKLISDKDKAEQGKPGQVGPDHR